MHHLNNNPNLLLLKSKLEKATVNLTIQEVIEITTFQIKHVQSKIIKYSKNKTRLQIVSQISWKK